MSIRRRIRSNKQLINLYTSFSKQTRRNNIIKELFNLHSQEYKYHNNKNYAIKIPINFKFSQKLLDNFESFYLNKNNELTDSHNLKIGNKVLKEIGKLKSGTYGHLTIYEDNIVMKEFESTTNLVEEIMISQIIRSNGLHNTIPILPVLNKDHALIMPQVQSDLESFYEKMIHEVGSVKKMDKATFGIIECVLHCLVRFQEKRMYYTDLKLPNMLVLLTKSNEIRVIFGDIGSFVYLKDGWKGFGSDVATYPPPNSQVNKNVISLGHILPNRRRVNNKNLFNKMVKPDYMEKTMSWIFGTFIMNILYMLMNKNSKKRYHKFFLYGNILHANKKDVEDKIEEELNNYHKFFKRHECKYILKTINVLPKLLKYNNSDRTELKKINLNTRVRSRRQSRNSGTSN